MAFASTFRVTAGGVDIGHHLASHLVIATGERVADSLCGRTPEEASADAAWVLELLWLMTDTEEAVPIRSAASFMSNLLAGSLLHPTPR